jgi:arylsulfatase A-like enzyme
MAVRRHARSAAAATVATAAVLGLALAVLSSVAGCSRRGAAHANRPDNVVLVVIDTLRRDHLATWGYDRNTAPFLDELARQGAAFEAITPAPWTKPATVSLLTGLHPVHHQAVDRLDRIPPGALTLAERLRRAGYHTLAMSANGWVSHPFGFDRGFDRFLLADNLKAPLLNRELLPHLDRLKPPFFLYIHYIDPHLPYEPEVAWDGRPLTAAERAHPVTIDEVSATHFLHRSPELLARARDLYDGEIRGVDDALRAVVGRLTQRGLMAHTVLVVTADHGEELEDHGRMSHGQTVYQELLQVPLVIRSPRLPAGRRPGRASLMDVVPTLLDLLGIDRSGEDLDGESLAGALGAGPTETPAADRPFLSYLDFVDGTGLSLIRGSHKLVLGKNPYRKELFDLAADPHERTNLLGRPGTQGVFAQLAGDLARLFNGYSKASFARSDATIDDYLVKRLAGLGYVAGKRVREPRVVPRRLDPADPFPDGALGWEPAGVPCADLGTPEAERSLLAGWYAQEPAGRWTAAPTGALLLSPPPVPLWSTPALALQVTGTNLRQAPVKLTLSVDHHPVLAAEVPAGPFTLTAPLKGVGRRSADLVEIATDKPFLPASVGLVDDRVLGIFVGRVCLQAVGTGGS